MTANAPALKAAVVDYGLGNLFSVRQACERVGLRAAITADKKEILAADAVILPGVGAFGDAMATLHRLDLVGVLRDVAAADKPLIGICLGIQLLLSESCEFGVHHGLNIIEGRVVGFDRPRETTRVLKVPQVQWNQIFRPAARRNEGDPWAPTPLAGLSDGEYQYFVHSFYVQPADRDVVLSVSRYGDVEFCSALRRRNVFACQFHPERSGPAGLRVYDNLARFIRAAKGAGSA